VRGQTPGTATIVATSGSTTARSNLIVLSAEASAETLATQAYEVEPGPPEEPEETTTQTAAGPPEDREPDRHRLDAAISAGVQQCYDALRSKNVVRVAELYQPVKASDKNKLNKLTRILRTEEWDAVVGERVDGTRRLRPEAATMDFGFQLVWKDAFGGRLTSRPVFRAEFAKNGNDWEITSCRIVGSPKL
jgi:hypothetical protein